MTGAAVQNRTYIALVIKEEDTSFWVHFPDLKYCFTCGETMDHAEDNARDALATHIAGLVRDGYRIPEPSRLEDILARNEAPLVEILEVPVEMPAQEAHNTVTRLRPPPRGPRQEF